MFHLHVETPIGDGAVDVNSAPVVIGDLSARIFNEIGPTVRISTVSGDIDVGLTDLATPLTVQNFLNYVNANAYNGTVIHRTEPLPTPFVIQGGGYLPSGTHITTNTPVNNEFSPTRPNVRGTIAMAKTSDPNSATSEWFINLGNNTSLDQTSNSGGFTTFGQVQGNGMAVADAIDALPRVNASLLNGAFNHFPVTQATNPPLPTLSTTNANDTGTPTTPDQSQMVIVNNISVLNQRHGVTYSVQSTNPGLVNPVLSGTNNSTLTLNYGAGLRGVATVTVTATEADTGATATDTFDVTVGAITVNIGQGSNAQTVTFTDADGTQAKVSVAGGAAAVSVGGNNLGQTTTGRTVNITGSNLALGNMILTGTRPRANITTTGPVGNDRQITLDGLSSDGPAGGLNGKGVILRGSSIFNNAVATLNVAGTQGATITINRGGSAGFTEPTITIGTATDTDITSQAPLKLRLGSWGGTDADADTITTPAVRSMLVKGAFNGDMAVSGNGQRTGSPAVANAGITGDLSGTWTVGSIKGLRAGSLTNFVLRSAGDVGSVSATKITGSTIFAGVNDATLKGTLPASAGEFITPATIKSVAIKGRSTAAQFINSVIAATTLGKLSLGTIQVDNGGTPFGAAADSIGSILGTGSSPIRAARLTDATQSITQSDFQARVF